MFIFLHISVNCILYPFIFAKVWGGGGGRLRGLKSKLRINKMRNRHIRCKMGRYRFGGRLKGLKNLNRLLIKL